MKNSSAKVFGDVLYAQCWEDPELDRAAFRIGPQDTVFTITSGGCNTLAFLLDSPKRVYALDLNPHQNFLLDLKMAAIAGLDYDAMLEFLGARDSTRRWRLYGHIRSRLQESSRRFWDTQEQKIAAGVIHGGRYEGYMKLLRTWLRRIKGRALIDELFAADDPADRLRIFHERWDTPGWRLFTRTMLSRRMMGMLFTDDFFRYVEGSFSFGEHFAGQLRNALTAPSLRQNYFASYALRGKYDELCGLPAYLQRENFEPIRARLDRVEMVTRSCEEFFAECADSSIQKFNFTNIFEWMSPAAFERLLNETWRVGAPGAVLTYRNLLVFRERPPALGGRIGQRRTLAQELHIRDRSFVYRNYVVEIIRKEDASWNMKSERSAIGTA